MKYKSDNCKFCKRLILNKGSLVSHMQCCLKNKNRIKKIRSPKAGRKKGSIGWNKNKKFPERTLNRILSQIKSGEYKQFCDTVIRRTIKQYLIHKYGHKCMICSLSEWQNQRIPLVCDHIDGNSQDIDITNFRVICNNCDSLLPTFKGKNKGKGRKTRYFGTMAERSKAEAY